MQERLTRVPFTRPIYVSAEGAWPRPRRLLAGNVSKGGMFVRADSELSPGTKVGVSLEAKGKVYPFAEAEVVWAAEPEGAKDTAQLPGFGLRFLRFLHPRSENLIDHLLHRNAGLPEDVGNQVVGAPEPSSPPPDFAQTPIREPSMDSAPLSSDDSPPPERSSALDQDEQGARLATAIGLITVLVVVGGGMLFLIQRNNAQLAASQPAAAAAPAAITEPEAAPEEPEAAVAEAAPAPAPIVEAAPQRQPDVEPAPEPRVAPRGAAPAPAAAPNSAPARSVALSSGAAKSVKWTQRADSLELAVSLAEGASIERVFSLRSPDRVVIDLNGPGPTASEKKVVQDGAVTMVRTGLRDGGTRLVLDVRGAVAKAEATASGARVEFGGKK